MVIRGRDRFENLSAAGGARPGPPVPFGDYVVPQAVAWVSEPIGTSPGVRAEYVMRGSRPECVSLVITSSARGITTADLATIPGLERKGLDAFATFATRRFDDPEWEAGLNLKRTREIFTPRPSRVDAAMAGRSDDELELVARVYRENIDDAPRKAVEDALNVSARTAARRIEAARQRGLLPQTTQGKKKA